VPSLTSTPVTEPEGPTDRAAAKVTSPVPHARSNICHPVCGFRNETVCERGVPGIVVFIRARIVDTLSGLGLRLHFNCHKLTQTWLQYSKSVIRTSKTLSSAYILLLTSAKALLYLERQVFLYLRVSRSFQSKHVADTNPKRPDFQVLLTNPPVFFFRREATLQYNLESSFSAESIYP
jgi:hypothetical protein